MNTMPDRQAPVVVTAPPEGDGVAPVVFDSPHSGNVYPANFGAAVPRHLLEGGEDRFVDELFASTPGHGATLVAARFARTYIDVNRSLLDLQPEIVDGTWPEELSPGPHSALGVGLIFSRIGDDVPIYDRLLTVEEVQHRIELYWRPYHAALKCVLNRLQGEYSAVWHVNCHSMMPVGNALSPDPGLVRPDFVLGDLDGRSCAPEFTRFAASTLEKLGYSVDINRPYKGAEIVARYGRPAEGRHSLQIEINRSLYMNLDSLDRHAGFARLQEDLGWFGQELCGAARNGGLVAMAMAGQSKGS